MALRSTNRRIFLRHSSYQRRSPAPISPELGQILEKYATAPPRPLNLGTLISFGQPLTSNSVLDSVSYALAEIPRRLATRVRSLEGLPFIVGTNPYVANTLNAYRESFQWLAAYKPPTTLEENTVFAEKLEGLVERHAGDIPTLAKGFQECSRYMSPTQISHFLDRAIQNRISVRLIAEQHIALSRSVEKEPDSKHIGVVDTKCSPSSMLSMCGSFVSDLCEGTLGASPALTIDGDSEATFAYVPVHLEYILTELLKNSFRATVEHHHRQRKRGPLPPVLVTLSPPSPQRASSPDGNFFSIRIRDAGGGVSATNMARIFSYAFTTAGRGAENHGAPEDETEGGPYAAQQVGGSAGMAGSEDGGLFAEITGKGLQTGLGTIAGLGYGLPMSRLYAQFFGGSLDLMSLEGWGSDVFLKLRCLDKAGDAII
ncbi:atypical/PDHK/BCKDK protein kinase [Mycena floridula]|nr:atypical/PDHK/BCKDK protein kinase [Mycena floridula]